MKHIWSSCQLEAQCKLYEIELREGEGRWDRGEKPKAMVVLKEETRDKEMIHKRRLERVAIKR